MQGGTRVGAEPTPKKAGVSSKTQGAHLGSTYLHAPLEVAREGHIRARSLAGSRRIVSCKSRKVFSAYRSLSVCHPPIQAKPQVAPPLTLAVDAVQHLAIKQPANLPVLVFYNNRLLGRERTLREYNSRVHSKCFNSHLRNYFWMALRWSVIKFGSKQLCGQ